MLRIQLAPGSRPCSVVMDGGGHLGDDAVLHVERCFAFLADQRGTRAAVSALAAGEDQGGAAADLLPSTTHDGPALQEASDTCMQMAVRPNCDAAPLLGDDGAVSTDELATPQYGAHEGHWRLPHGFIRLILLRATPTAPLGLEVYCAEQDNAVLVRSITPACRGTTAHHLQSGDRLLLLGGTVVTFATVGEMHEAIRAVRDAPAVAVVACCWRDALRTRIRAGESASLHRWGVSAVVNRCRARIRPSLYECTLRMVTNCLLDDLEPPRTCI